MKGLTKRQQEILRFIQEFTQANNYSPSFREIAAHFQFRSLGTVFRHIDSLKKKKALDQESRSRRSLVVTTSEIQSHSPSEMMLPLIGHLSQEGSIETFSQSRHIAVPASFVSSPDNTYVLRVRGDSLQDEMIQDGDLLVVEARQIAEPSEIIIAALSAHETVVRRYFPEGDYVKLLSQNPALSPLIVQSSNLNIQAILVALLRLF